MRHRLLDGSDDPPPLQIPNKKPASLPKPETPAGPKPPPLPVPADLQSNLAPLVPSCVVVAGYLQTFALSDVEGQTWNFHKDRKGKLVLLDFWTPSCVYCLQAMSGLSQLQSKYGSRGLEVVGVLLDNGAAKEQAARAKLVCYRQQANYRQVLGQDEKTNLRGQFDLQYFPTMLLIDDTGRVVWRHVGAADPAMLDNVVGKHLGGKTL